MPKFPPPTPISALHRRLMESLQQSTGCDDRFAFNSTLAQAAKESPIERHGDGVAAARDVWAKFGLPNKGKKP